MKSFSQSMLLRLLSAFSSFKNFMFMRGPQDLSGKRTRTPNQSDKRTWDLVRSYGDGTGLFKCRQKVNRGESQFKRLPITNLNSMSKDARWYFAERNA